MSFAGRSWWVAIEDIGRLRDGVGVAVPLGVPATFTEEVADPLGELLGRYARTRTPFTTAEAAARFGLGLRVTADVLGRLADARPAGARRLRRRRGAIRRTGGEQWCDAEVLRILRRRSLAALRAQVEPVSTAAYARFLPAWHHVGAGSPGPSGLDGLMSVIDQLAGVRIPASAIEPLVLAPRVRDYSPAMLDELLATGEVTWSGAGSISGSDGWIALHASDSASADPGRTRRDRLHRRPPGDPGHPGGRRRVLLPPARTGRTQRIGPQSRAVGTDLGRPGHRRYVRPGARVARPAPVAANVPRPHTGRAARRG